MDLTPPYDCSRIAPLRLFVSGLQGALNGIEGLRKLGVTRVVVCANDISPPAHSDLSVLWVKALDTNNCNLIEHFDACFEFIDAAIASGDGVLIHCLAGVSRSASIACAYLMRKLMIDASTALETIQETRPQVRPNPGFWQQLLYYEQLNWSYDHSGVAEMGLDAAVAAKRRALRQHIAAEFSVRVPVLRLL